MLHQVIQEQLAHFENICRSSGLKVTHQRMEVYRELITSQDHPAAETLYKRLEKRLPTLSLDTVYRTLATFEAHKLVQRIETKESQARYEAITTKHHHHICDECGMVTDFYWHSFDSLALPGTLEKIGTVDRADVVIHGRCTACTDNG